MWFEDPSRMSRVTRDVCGSWSDNDYISCDEQVLKSQILVSQILRPKFNAVFEKMP